MTSSDDPSDNLQDLSEHLQENIGATGVYIGELEYPFQTINDEADENAHLNKESPEVLKFKWAKGDHADSVVGTELPPNKGICHEALSEEITTANNDLKAAAESDQLVNYYKHIYCKEVVREPKIHYWKVPRLGAFMAVPLVYKSCLNEDSFNKAYNDFNTYMDEIKSIEE